MSQDPFNRVEMHTAEADEALERERAGRRRVIVLFAWIAAGMALAIGALVALLRWIVASGTG